MEVVYLYDGTPFIVEKDDEGENIYPTDEWTTVKPTPGIYQPFYFDGNKWIGSTKEEWEASLPDKEIDPPNDGDILNSQLIINDLEQNAKINILQQDIANLTAQLLKIQGGN